MPRSFTRRQLLRCAGAAGAGLWLGDSRAAVAPEPAVLRVVLLHAPGGIRFTSTFDAQSDAHRNPWGVLPWQLVGRGRAPAWGVGRVFLQRPLPAHATSWADRIYPYLTSDDPAHYNVGRPQLVQPGWRGALGPSFADLASEMAVVRTTIAPGQAFNSDHGSAARTLMTGSRGGRNGMVTRLHHGLRQRWGAAFDARHPFPSAVIGERTWSLGDEGLEESRPIYLPNATALPQFPARTGGVGRDVLAAEAALDGAFAGSRPEASRQLAANLASDKRNGDAHLPRLLDPALRLLESPTSALGRSLHGDPITNAMLQELFALGGAATPKDDIAHDAAWALTESRAPFDPADNPIGLGGALAIRMLQLGSPLVAVTVGRWDTHANEVIDPVGRTPLSAQAVLLGRTMAALDLALRRIEDPLRPGRALHETTVVLCCSEFGRGGSDVGADGFNAPNGLNRGGSDHDPWAAVPLFGGPVARAGAAGRLVRSASDDGFYEQNRVFASLGKALGIDAAARDRDSPSAAVPIPGLLPDEPR